eukprot:8981859-Pyramimonas_sp.AAC.1
MQTTCYRGVLDGQLAKGISGGALDVAQEGPPPPEATMAPISSEGLASPVPIAPTGSNEAPGHQGNS